MLRIYPVILAFVADVYPFVERIGRHDPDLDGGARFAALRESNGKDARLVRDGLPSGPFGSIERGASRALSSLLPKLRIANANPRHALNE